MLSGRRLDLLDPSPADIAIEDIAHGLARVARWNGQTLGDHAYSVAQHALLVEEIARARMPGMAPAVAARRAAARCARVRDRRSDQPLQAAIGLDYKAFEMRLLEAIHRRFGLPAPLPADVAAEIKAADRIAAYYEATRLAGFRAGRGRAYFGAPVARDAATGSELGGLVEPWPVADVQAAFLERCWRKSRTRVREAERRRDGAWHLTRPGHGGSHSRVRAERRARS